LLPFGPFCKCTQGNPSPNPLPATYPYLRAKAKGKKKKDFEEANNARKKIKEISKQEANKIRENHFRNPFSEKVTNTKHQMF
jgi:hypothetical protein